MGNMSYCRFENTAADMQDCIWAIEEGDTYDLSKYELRAIRDFLELARMIVDLEGNIEEIIERNESNNAK